MYAVGDGPVSTRSTLPPPTSRRGWAGVPPPPRRGPRPGGGRRPRRVPIALTQDANLFIDAVDLDVRFTLCLDALEVLASTLKNVDSTLKCDKRGIVTPLKRKDSHIYLEWSKDVHNTTGELEMLHRHFNQPNAERLAAVLRQSRDPKIATGTQEPARRKASTKPATSANALPGHGVAYMSPNPRATLSSIGPC